MKRPGTLCVALACVGTLAFAASAQAITIVAGPGAETLNYQASSYTIDQGGIIGFTNNDPGVNHDVTARGRIGGRPLFSTPTLMGPGNGQLVDGTEYLTTGSYEFFCSVHPLSMEATLNVTGAGTPVARPKLDVKILSGDIDRVANRRRARVRVTALTDSDDASVVLKLKALRLGGKSNIDLDAGQSRVLALRLTRRAKNKLEDRDRAKVKLVGSVPFGANDTATKVLN